MKISIITPSLNQGRFLRNCIESVLNQKGVDVEHMVIDAGSTDETLDILRSYPHIDWVSEPDKGMSDGINKGFRKATGDYLIWLNCDDFLMPGALENVVACLQNRPDIDVLHGDCVFVREDGSPIYRKRDHPADEFTLLFVGCFIPSTSTFLSRRIIEAGEFLNISYRVCMDWDYYLRLLRRGYKFHYLGEALAGFRWHGNNASMVLSKRGEQEALELQRLHIDEADLPAYLKSGVALSLLRRVAQLVRTGKRFAFHHRLR